jgi:aspartate racemase
MMASEQPLIGVLGGMGPLATVDFMHKLVEEMPARIDQEHVPVVAWNVAQIPDRQKALAGAGESPLPAMREGVRQLLAAGATRLVIPCNTAHYWLPQLSADCPVPFISIIDATLNVLNSGTPSGTAETIGLVATRGTLLAGLYQQRLEAEGMRCLCNTDAEMDALFTPGCYAVKRGEVEAGGRLLEAAAEALLARGATRLVLACTEVPVALERVASRHLPLCVDTNRALARACVDYWQQVRPR